MLDGNITILKYIFLRILMIKRIPLNIFEINPIHLKIFTIFFFIFQEGQKKVSACFLS